MDLRRYLTAEGRCPFQEWFDRLRDQRAQQRIDARLARVAVGNFGDAKGVGGGVMELRVDYGPGYRVYLARNGEQWVLLLGGGDKSTQAGDIQEAKQRWADWQARQPQPTTTTKKGSPRV